MNDLTNLSAAFVAQTYKVAMENKPDVTKFEVTGLAFRILVSALDNYEQLQKSSSNQGSERIEKQPRQVQEPRTNRRTDESTEGVRDQQRSLTKSGLKKRRNKKGS